MLDRLMTAEVIECLFYGAFLILTFLTFALIGWVFGKVRAMFKKGDIETGAIFGPKARKVY